MMRKIFAILALAWIMTAGLSAKEQFPMPLCIESCVYEIAEGKLAFPTVFERAGYFGKNGLARVRLNDKYGYIDTKGKMVIPAKFDNAGENFAHNGLAMVRLNNKEGYINEKGEVVISIVFGYAEAFQQNGLARVQPNGLGGSYGYIDAKGEMVIPATFDRAGDFSHNGLAKVVKDHKHGYINTKGEIIIPTTFDYAGDFSQNGLARVTIDRRHGYINAKGEMVIPATFDYTSDFSQNGLAPVGIGRITSKWGYINAKGKMVIPPTFNNAKSFSQNGLAVVEINGKYGYINAAGAMVIPATFDYAESFGANGLAKVKLDDAYILINKKGQKRNSPILSTIAQASNQDEFDLFMSFGSKSAQQLYLEASELEQNNSTKKAEMIYKYIAKAYPNSEFAVKISDKFKCENNKKECNSRCGRYKQVSIVDMQNINEHNNRVTLCHTKCGEISCR